MASWSWWDGVCWVPYAADLCASLEEQFAKPPAERAFVQFRVSSGAVYHIDTVTMEQVNTATGYLRPVTRMDATTEGGGAAAMTWQFKDDDGSWKDYDSELSRVLSEDMQAGKDRTVFLVNFKKYTVLFAHRVQVNMSTRYQREVQAIPARPTASRAASRRAPVIALLRKSVSLDATSEPPSHKRVKGALDQDDVAKITAWSVEDHTSAEIKDEDCTICLEKLGEVEPEDAVVRLSACSSHWFHRSCIVSAFQHSTKCPFCSHLYAPLVGTQPDGTMEVFETLGKFSVAGYPSCGAIVIVYTFPHGVQGPSHAHPGVPYTGTVRMAFLPNEPEGRKAVELLEDAFTARLLFVIGQSTTTGVDDTVIWGGVHHKTSPTGGAARHGWPDETYFTRLYAELAAKGIKPAPPPAAEPEGAAPGVEAAPRAGERAPANGAGMAHP